jgi:adenylyl-sulfate kinase
MRRNNSPLWNLGSGQPTPSTAPSNVVWHGGKVSQVEREHLYRQRAATLWLTGLSGAGKSTLAFELERRLLDQGHACYVLDGDNVRHGLNRDLGFSPDDRHENIRRVAEVANLMNDAGLFVITSFISPYRADRELARQLIGENRFLEVWVQTDLATCEQRDPKGLYAKARAGTLPDFTGISAPYEPPQQAALAVDTRNRQIADCVGELLTLVAPRFV